MKTSRVLSAIWNCPLNCGVRIALATSISGHVDGTPWNITTVPSLAVTQLATTTLWDRRVACRTEMET